MEMNKGDSNIFATSHLGMRIDGSTTNEATKGGFHGEKIYLELYPYGNDTG